LDSEKIREDFPALVKKSDRTPPIYFDNLSVTLTPQPVIDSIMEYYSEPGNLRSAHEFSINTMQICNESRVKVGNLINADSSNNIIWTKNATEGINLIANTLNFKPGDIVLTTDKEHNSNLVPWHDLKSRGVKHKIIESNNDNTFDLNRLEKILSEEKSVRLVSLSYTSIIDGYTLPAKDIIKISHEHGAMVLLDCVLTVPQQSVDVQALGVDFMVFSLGNMCGPNGLGVLYGKFNLLEKLQPFLGGSGATDNITYEGSNYQGPPAKFEAGTQNSASIIGAGATIDYLNSIGISNIKEHLFGLNKLLTDELGELDKIEILGPNDPKLRGGIFNFNIKDVNPHDVSISLEDLGRILVRSGHLCAHSWFNQYMKDGAVSVSFYIYNTTKEAEYFISILKQLIKDFF
jgi:cysteine desulfurase/selenocysteine lyase